MNLTRMRNVGFIEKFERAYMDYSKITAPITGQRVLNVLLYYNPGYVMKMPSHLHFKVALCKYGFYCKEALDDFDGVHLIHATAGRFGKGRIFYPMFWSYQQV